MLAAHRGKVAVRSRVKGYGYSCRPGEDAVLMCIEIDVCKMYKGFEGGWVWMDGVIH